MTDPSPGKTRASKEPPQLNASVKLGIWGLGRHARKNILGSLARCDQVQLYGVFTRNQVVAIGVANEYGCKSWSSYQEMLADPELDAVFIATPTGLHYEHGRAVLAAGKHLWMEKAFTTCEHHAEDLVERSQTIDVAICEAFMHLYHPQYRRLQEIVCGEDFGKVMSINCRFGLPPLQNPGFRNSDALGGGALLDVGSYTLSAVLELMEDQELDVISASVMTPPDSEVDKDGFGVLRFSNGGLAFLEWGIGRAYKNEIEVWGEHASVYADKIFSKPEDLEATLICRDQFGRISEELTSAANAYTLMFKAFSEACHDKILREKERKRISRQAHYLEMLSGR